MSEVKEINYNISKLERCVISKSDNDKLHNIYYTMYPIDERLEHIIDTAIEKDVDINIELENGLPIKLSAITLYGKVDILGSDHNIVESIMKVQGSNTIFRIPKGFDYKTNTSVTDINGIPHCETFDFIKAFEYYHARIGKPERILIMKTNEKFIKQTSRFRYSNSI